MENETPEKLRAVPEGWFKSLLDLAEKFDEAQKKWEYGKSEVHDNILLKAVTLAGYAKSAKYVLQNNQIVEQSKK